MIVYTTNKNNEVKINGLLISTCVLLHEKSLDSGSVLACCMCVFCAIREIYNMNHDVWHLVDEVLNKL